MQRGRGGVEGQARGRGSRDDGATGGGLGPGQLRGAQRLSGSLSLLNALHAQAPADMVAAVEAVSPEAEDKLRVMWTHLSDTAAVIVEQACRASQSLQVDVR